MRKDHMKIYLLSRGKEYEFDFTRDEYYGVAVFISYFNLKRFQRHEYRLSHFVNSGIPQSTIDIAVDNKKSFQTLPEHKFLASEPTENSSDFYELENGDCHEYVGSTNWHNSNYNEYMGMKYVANILLDQKIISRGRSKQHETEMEYYDNVTGERFITIVE